MSSVKEEDLWHMGLPIIFVVDKDGRAVFHTDSSLAASARPLNDLKIVSEWRESGSQVESALCPVPGRVRRRKPRHDRCLLDGADQRG